MKNIFLPVVALALIISTCLFSACQKKVWYYPDTLEAHKWKLTSYSENGRSLTIPECQKEEVYSFYNTGLGYDIAGAVRCDTSTEVSDTVANFGWSVSGDQEQIYIKHFGTYDYNPVWTIAKYSETSFEVTGVDQRNDSSINYDRVFIAIN